ncbi:Phospholipase D-like domain [Phytophthora cactorum]|nr:Phospholipase D-like domain [Phytophthora cactorum]
MVVRRPTSPGISTVVFVLLCLLSWTPASTSTRTGVVCTKVGSVISAATRLCICEPCHVCEFKKMSMSCGYIERQGLDLSDGSSLKKSQLHDVVSGVIQRGGSFQALVWANLLDKSQNIKVRDDINAIPASPTGEKPLFVFDDRTRIVTSSHHQKNLIIASANSTGIDEHPVAFVGGVDITSDRWDTMYHNESALREATGVSGSYKGWLDGHVRIHGPAAKDVAANFLARWNSDYKPTQSLAHDLLDFENPSYSDLAPLNYASSKTSSSVGRQNVQIVRTFSCQYKHYAEFAPRGENSLFQARIKAVKNAKNFIYIEDQYFILVPELLTALLEVMPTIQRLIVVVQRPVGESKATGYDKYLFDMIAPIQKFYPNKLQVYSTKKELNLYIHSKVVIIDDVYLSVGSANWNRRSMTSDSELGANIIDDVTVNSPDGVTVLKAARDFRIRKFQEMTGLSYEKLDTMTLIEAANQFDVALLVNQASSKRTKSRSRRDHSSLANMLAKTMNTHMVIAKLTIMFLCSLALAPSLSAAWSFSSIFGGDGDSDSDFGSGQQVPVLPGVKVRNKINKLPKSGINDGNALFIFDDRLPYGMSSQHQKALVIAAGSSTGKDDHPVAYVGGIDLSNDRWDTIYHNVSAIHDLVDFENPQYSYLPPLDYASSNTTSKLGNQNVQIVRTFSCLYKHWEFAPNGENSLFHARIKAIRNAKNFIYIEDQYFILVPELLDALMEVLPGLQRLIVIAQSPELITKSAGYEKYMYQNVQSIKEKFPNKFKIYSMKPKLDVYVHSKLVVVDDVYLSDGSANWNRRSMTSDPELDANVVDSDIVNTPDGIKVGKVIRDFRVRKFQEMTGPAEASSLIEKFEVDKEWYYNLYGDAIQKRVDPQDTCDGISYNPS